MTGQGDGPLLPLWSAWISTELVVEQLSHGRRHPLPRGVEHLALQRLVATRDCPWCGARKGQLCHTHGGQESLRRTHPLRILLTSRDRTRLVAAALREAAAMVRAQVREDLLNNR